MLWLDSQSTSLVPCWVSSLVLPACFGGVLPSVLYSASDAGSIKFREDDWLFCHKKIKSFAFWCMLHIIVPLNAVKWRIWADNVAHYIAKFLQQSFHELFINTKKPFPLAATLPHHEMRCLLQIMSRSFSIKQTTLHNTSLTQEIWSFWNLMLSGVSIDILILHNHVFLTHL